MRSLEVANAYHVREIVLLHPALTAYANAKFAMLSPS